MHKQTSLQGQQATEQKMKGTSVVAAFAFTGRKTDASLCDRLLCRDLSRGKRRGDDDSFFIHGGASGSANISLKCGKAKRHQAV